MGGKSYSAERNSFIRAIATGIVLRDGEGVASLAAAKMGVGQPALKMLRAGDRGAGLGIVEPIADYLKVKVDDVLKGRWDDTFWFAAGSFSWPEEMSDKVKWRIARAVFDDAALDARSMSQTAVHAELARRVAEHIANGGNGRKARRVARAEIEIAGTDPKLRKA